METTTTLLIDRCRLCRESLTILLSNAAFPVIGQVAELKDGLTAIEAGAAPGLIILDFTEDNPADLEMIGRIRAAAPETRMVLLACRFSVAKMTQALAAGVDACLVRDISTDVLIHYLQLVTAGEKVLPGELASWLAASVSEPLHRREGAPTRLSKREGQILERLITGDSNKVIAARLSISEATVKVHLKSLLRKIQATNRVQAVAWAVRNRTWRDDPDDPACPDTGKSAA